jgi:hypothetical protein
MTAQEDGTPTAATHIGRGVGLILASLLGKNIRAAGILSVQQAPRR